MKSKGFTIIELACVIVILSILSSVLMPIFAASTLNYKAKSAKVNLHRFWNGLMIYQSNYDEKVQFGSPEEMGLPPEALNFGEFVEDFTGDHHRSWKTKLDFLPCGRNVGDQDFDGLGYLPLVKNDWITAVKELRGNTALIYDKNCNLPGTRVMCQFCEKRSIGITLNGNIRDRISIDWKVYDQHFYQ